MHVVSSGLNNIDDNEQYDAGTGAGVQQDDEFYQHSDSGNNQDADAMGNNVASQDDSMEVEYNDDNLQDQQEYF